MTEWVLSRTAITRSITNWSSGAFAASVCWCCGISLVTAAVLFSVGGAAPARILGMLGLSAGSMMCGLAKTASPWLRLRLAGMLISSVTLLLISEVALRVFTNFPVSTTCHLIPHAKLGYVLDPETHDVDPNGFRNPVVVDQVKIIAIGDSHTQGVNVPSSASWPQQLGRQLNTTVYNMGIEGYGPRHYEVLIDHALKLQPQVIIVGLSVGNVLREFAQGIEPRHSAAEVDNSFRHMLKSQTAIGSSVQYAWNTSRIGRPSGIEIEHALNPVYASYGRIEQYAHDMDVTDPKIEAAFGTTIGILENAQRRCREHGADLLVMLIPTRESVYAAAEKTPDNGPFYERPDNADSQTDGQQQRDLLEQMVRRETTLRTHLTAVLGERGVTVLDILPDMASAVNSTPNIYACNDDEHPLANGYAVHAAAVARSIQAK